MFHHDQWHERVLGTLCACQCRCVWAIQSGVWLGAILKRSHSLIFYVGLPGLCACVRVCQQSVVKTILFYSGNSTQTGFGFAWQVALYPYLLVGSIFVYLLTTFLGNRMYGTLRMCLPEDPQAGVPVDPFAPINPQGDEEAHRNPYAHNPYAGARPGDIAAVSGGAPAPALDAIEAVPA